MIIIIIENRLALFSQTRTSQPPRRRPYFSLVCPCSPPLLPRHLSLPINETSGGVFIRDEKKNEVINYPKFETLTFSRQANHIEPLLANCAVGWRAVVGLSSSRIETI